MLILFTSLALTTSYAQETIEELKSSLEQAEGTELIDIQQKLASRIRQQDLDRADSIVRISIKEAQKISYKRGEALGLAILGGIIGNKGDFYKAEELINNAITLAKTHNEKKALTAAYINLGALYTRNDLKKLAIEQHIIGAQIASLDTTLIDFEITHLMNIGAIHLINENMYAAKQYLKEAQEKSETRKRKFRTAQIYVNQAIVETNLKNFGAALELYSKGLEIFKQENLELYFHKTQIEIARCYIDLNQLTEAKKYLDAANTYYTSSDINQITKKSIAHLKYNYADYYYRTGNYNTALSIINEVIRFANKSEINNLSLKSYQLCAKIYENKGDFKEALQISKKAFIIKDSLLKEEKKASILSLSKMFDYERLKQEKINQFNTLDAEIKQRNTYVVILLCLVLLSVFLALLNKNRLKLNYLKKQIEMNAEQQKIIQEAKKHQSEKEYLIKKTYELIEKNKTLSNNLKGIQTLKESNMLDEQGDLLIQKIRSSLFNDKNWLEFNLYFNKLYPNFYQTLKSNFKVKFTLYEQRLLALMKLELTNKEIGVILGIQRNSVVQAKIRLRDKLKFKDLSQMDTYLRSNAF